MGSSVMDEELFSVIDEMFNEKIPFNSGGIAAKDNREQPWVT
jgi:hypothetical protein